MINRKLFFLMITMVMFVLLFTVIAMSENKPFEGVEINIAAFAGGPKGVISGVLYEYREEWQNLTGAKLTISEVPYGALYEKIFTDLFTGAGQYDGFITQAWFLGDFVAGDYVVPIDEYMKDPSLPSWDPNDVIPPVQALLRWGDKWYAPPFDGDQFVLWYRKDVLNDEQWKSEFKEKYGYELPNPPQTIDQLIDVSSFFNNIDWNKDGENDYGIAIFLKSGSLGGYFYGVAMTAPYSVFPGEKVDQFHNIYWFDPETMEPLITNPGYIMGLEKLKKLVNEGGSSSMMSWDLGESWNAFVSGKSVFAINTADIGSMAQQSEVVKGNLGGAPIPGSNEVWNREKNEWKKLDEPNKVGNLLGANWQGIISKFSKNPKAVYHLFAFLADKERLFKAAAAGWTGVDPTTYSQFLPPYGNASLDQYLAENWNPADAQAYSNVLFENLMKAKSYTHYLRIRGTNDFSIAMDTMVNEFLTNQIDAETAVSKIATEWNKTIESLGRDKLKEEYQTSINYGGTPSP